MWASESQRGTVMASHAKKPLGRTQLSEKCVTQALSQVEVLVLWLWLYYLRWVCWESAGGV